MLAVTSNVWDQAVAENADSVNTSGISAQSLINATRIAVIVVGVVFVALYLLFAFKMRAGRNWARIVLKVPHFRNSKGVRHQRLQ